MLESLLTLGLTSNSGKKGGGGLVSPLLGQSQNIPPKDTTKGMKKVAMDAQPAHILKKEKIMKIKLASKKITFTLRIGIKS